MLVAAAALLGVWQLDAWQTRRADEARDLTRADPVALASVMGPDDPFPGRSVGQPVTLEGDWVPDGTVFVSDREHDGQDGYWMVTPLAIGGAGRSRRCPSCSAGWPTRPSAPAPPEGSADLVGWLQPPEGTGAVDDDPDDDVLPQLRIADLVQHVDQDLYGGYAVAQHGVAGLPAADLVAAPGRRPVHRDPQPLLRLRVVVLRRLRGAHLVALARRAAALPSEEPQAEDEDQPDTVTT